MKNGKKYIQFLSGILLEGKFANTITKKIGLPQFLANDIEESYGKYAIWVADSYKKYITKLLLDNVLQFDDNTTLTKQEIDALFKSEDEDFFNFIINQWQGKYKGELYDYVHDWLVGRNSGAVIENDKLNFKELTAIKAYTRAHDWHRELEKVQTGIVVDEQGEVVMTFPDGYYWIKLDAFRCDDEAKAMGHCGIGTKGGNLFSLRKDKKPVVTVDLVNGIIKQIRGKANTKPKNDYHKYITDFILSDLVKGFEYDMYRTDDNFYVTDLDAKDVDKIISSKTSLMKNQELDKLSNEQIAKLIEKEPGYFPLSKHVNVSGNKEEVQEKLIKLFFEKSTEHNNYELSEFLKSIKKSGKYFEEILIESLDEDVLLKTFKEVYKKHSENDRNILKDLVKQIAIQIPSSSDAIKKLFLTNKEVPKIFMINILDIVKYLDIICLRSIFGDDGIRLAVKFLDRPEIEKEISKQYGQEYYNAIKSEMIDSIS